MPYAPPVLKARLTVWNDFATLLAQPMKMSEIIQTGGRPALAATMSARKRRNGGSKEVEAWKSLMTWLSDKPSVFSEPGGKP